MAIQAPEHEPLLSLVYATCDRCDMTRADVELVRLVEPGTDDPMRTDPRLLCRGCRTRLAARHALIVEFIA